ncbi:MAG: hypothetical protein IVW53_08950 [Chloroflexi bacterium]|nr:hypothetical protein [Chloroflexota bacterium]
MRSSHSLDRIDVAFDGTQHVAAGPGTLITLHQTNIPEGQSGYEQGWRDNYFDPMRAFFTKR